MHHEYDPAKPAKQETAACKKVSETNIVFSSFKNGKKRQRRNILASKKSLQLMNVNTSPMISRLSRHGAACSCFCFDVQQEFDNTTNREGESFKIASSTEFLVPDWFH